MKVFLVASASTGDTPSLSKLFDPNGDGSPPLLAMSSVQAAIHVIVSDSLYGPGHRIVGVEINDIGPITTMNLDEIIENSPEVILKAQEIIEAHDVKF